MRGETTIPNRLDRIHGCLFAGACGDALGALVEFLSLEAIRGRFGHGEILDFAPAYGRVGAITDTQMTLFMLEGLVRAYAQGFEDRLAVLHRGHLRWLLSQGEQPRIALDPPDGWLFGIEALHHQRAPGGTCLSALSATAKLDRFVYNDSKGCGGVMRVAPFGFLRRL